MKSRSRDGSFGFWVPEDTMLTFSTTTGQSKGTADTGQYRPFPFPYSTDYNSDVVNRFAKYHADNGGAFDYRAEQQNQMREDKKRADENKQTYIAYLRERQKVRSATLSKAEELRKAAYRGRNPNDPKGLELAMEPLEEPPLPPLPDACAAARACRGS